MLALSRFGNHTYKQRIGLLGGSFNPAHKGHLEIAQKALKYLHLDQVWFLVSPGNPLKDSKDMASFSERLKTAELIADHRSIFTVDIEYRIKQKYTVRTVEYLKRIFPNIEFIWIMGSDCFPQLPLWKEWKKLSSLIPIAVFSRNDFLKALYCKAAFVLRHRRVYTVENLIKKGGWMFLPVSRNSISSSLLREKKNQLY